MTTYYVMDASTVF